MSLMSKHAMRDCKQSLSEKNRQTDERIMKKVYLKKIATSANYKLFSRTRCLMCSRFLSGVEQCKAQLCTQCESIGGMRRVSSSESAFIAFNPSPSFAAVRDIDFSKANEDDCCSHPRGGFI